MAVGLSVAGNLRWLQENPAFDEVPATISEFLEDGYLQIGNGIRPGVKSALIDIFGTKVNPQRMSIVEDFIASGSIGWGKSTLASIAMPYMVHFTLCLKNPQDFYELLPGSRIAFVMCSTSESQAREVIFADIKARIDYSPWFRSRYPYDPKTVRRIKFPQKDVWIIPGGSLDTTYEGFNVLGAVIDEIDCVDEQTEILTNEGWKDYRSLKIGDRVLSLNHNSGFAEWDECLNISVSDHGSHDVIKMQGKEFSSVTTLNHKWPVVRSGTKIPRKWATSETLGFRDKISRSAPLVNENSQAKYSDALVETVAWFYTEGHDRQDEGKTCSITQSQRANPGLCDRIRRTLTELFGEAVEYFPRLGCKTDGIPRWRERLVDNRDKYWGPVIVFTLSSDAGRIVQNLAPGRVPSFGFLNSLTLAQLELFIHVSMLADNNGEVRFSQKNRDAAESFMYACILSGRSVSLLSKKPTGSCPSVMWTVTMAKKQYHIPIATANLVQWRKKTDLLVTGMSITREIHEGVVWCPETRNHSWLARRNGTVYFTGNSHKQTSEKDYADLAYDAIRSRISSRFIDPAREGHRGLLVCIGQMKSSQGFASRKYKEFQKSKNADAVRMTIWDSLGWAKFSKPGGRGAGHRNSFWYDMKRHKIISSEVAQWVQSRENLIEVPEAYRANFVNNPVKALRDLAGIPPPTTDPFITMLDRLDEARDKWIERNGFDSPVLPDPEWPVLISGLKAPDNRKRAMHLDLAVSGGGDALGIAMGYVDGLVEEDGELKPYIVFDLLARIKAVPGSEIILSDVRRFIYHLRDDVGFKLVDVTLDGFESRDTMQLLRKKKFRADYLSVDRSTGPYETLREAIYDRRIEFPKFMTYLSRTKNDLIEIAYKELMELNYTGKKVDHPPKGSKDVSDAMAGVAEKLTGDRSYRKGATRPSGMTPPDLGGASFSKEGEGSLFNLESKSVANLGSLDSLSSLIPPHLRHKNRQR